MRFDRHDLIYRLKESWFFSIFVVRRRRSRRHRRRRQLLSIKTKTKAKTQAGEPARGARSALPVGRF